LVAGNGGLNWWCRDASTSICSNKHHYQKGQCMSSLARRKLRAGILGTLAGATVLGLAIASVGSASAATAWDFGIAPGTTPAGTNSVSFGFPEGSTCIAGPFEPHAIKWAGFFVFAGRGFSVTPYSDGACQGATLGPGVAYALDGNEDRAETGFDCLGVVVRVDEAGHHWINCGVRRPGS
jgi:hypothetical protein